MGSPRDDVPWARFGAEPQYKSVGDTTKPRLYRYFVADVTGQYQVPVPLSAGSGA